MPLLTRLPLAGLAALLLLGFDPAAAQVSFDFSLGPTFNWLADVEALVEDPDNPGFTTPDTLSYPVSVGIQAGVGAGFRTRNVGVRVGAQYLNTGGLFDGSEALNPEAFTINFVTAQVDVQYRYPLGPAELYAFGGPELRYLLDLSDVGSAQDVADSFRSNLEPLSTTLNLGVGVQLNVLGRRLGPEVRYAIGLSGISGTSYVTDTGSLVQLEDALRLNTLLIGLSFGR